MYDEPESTRPRRRGGTQEPCFNAGRLGSFAASGLVVLLGLLMAVPASAGSRAVRVYGYFDSVLGYNRYESDTMGWDAYHLDLLGSWVVDRNFRVVGDFTFEHGTEHTSSNLGDLKVRGYLETMVGEGFRLNVGKFLLPFGEQNLYHDASPAYLSVTSPRALYWKRAIGEDDEGGTVKDRLFSKTGTGAWAWGTLYAGSWEFEYNAYVTNGRGAQPYKVDDNRSPGVGGKATIRAPIGLLGGGSVYWDRHGKVADDLEILVYAGQLALDYEGVHLRTEVMPALSSSEEDKWRSLGWYGEGAYTIGDRVTPYVRFGDFTSEFHEQHEQILVGGANYAFPNHSVFIKAEYNHYFAREPAAESPIDEGEDVPSYVVQSQIAVAF